MWQDYEATYRATIQDPAFLAWRELGAQRKAENIACVCRRLSPQSVVEIGCGTGSVLHRLHEMNFAERYVCLDLSPSAVQFARSRCPAFASRAIAGAADSLPFRDGAFDIAILSHVIEHLESPTFALSEASRVARFVVVEVPTERVLSNLVRTKVLGRPYASMKGAGHVQFWSPASIVSFLQHSADLEIVSQHRDLLDEEPDAAKAEGDRGRAIVKRALRQLVPGSVYSRLVTTHSTFLCRRLTHSGDVHASRAV